MKKRVAVITGATGGIGREFTAQLLEEVDEIWAIGRNQKKLSFLKEELGEKIVPMSVDLSKSDFSDTIISRLQAEQPEITYLVNNAGTGRMAASTDFTTEELQNHIATHCTAMTILCNVCIPYMKAGSHIINMASQSAFQPDPYINLYAASKAFSSSYSRALNVELEKQGIKVIVVCPGWIKTDLLETERNGVKVEFPHLAEASKVVTKAIRDAKKGKDISVYGGYVNWQRFLVKIFPHQLVMKTWMKSIQQYI